MLPACHPRDVMREKHFGMEGSKCAECGASIPGQRPLPPLSPEAPQRGLAYLGLAFTARQRKRRYFNA